MRSWLLGATALAVGLTCRSASAQEEAGPEEAGPHAGSTSTSGSPNPMDDDSRYAWLSAEIKQIEGPTERWQTGFTWGFAWLAAGEWSLAAASPKKDLMQDSMVGAVIGTLALGNMLIQPNTMAGAQESLDQYDGSTAIGKYERRRHAEFLIEATASEEAFWHSLIPFTLNTVVNVAANSYLIWGLNQKLAGALSMGAGEIVTLIQIFSRPHSATHAWERYTKTYHPFPPSEIPPDQIDLIQKLHISFGVSPGGLGAVGSF